MDLGVKEMKSTPHYPDLEPHYQILFCIILRVLLSRRRSQCILNSANRVYSVELNANSINYNETTITRDPKHGPLE